MNRIQRFGLATCLLFIWWFLAIPEFTTFGYGHMPWYISFLFGCGLSMMLSKSKGE